MALTLRQAAIQPATVKRALIVSLIIGSLLCLINQWEAIIAGFIAVSWPKVMLAYLVPFGVSPYSTAASKVESDREKRNSTLAP